MSETNSIKLENFLNQYDLEKAINLMREMFSFQYTKSRSNDGVYIWFGDKDWETDSICVTAHIGYCYIIFIDYTEDQIINKFTKYYKLKVFL